ncbi:MAG: hypothetical protein ACD_4C00300G0004 [uncultured bacterium (gcode 4)]|uniref:ABC transmembrane type-1 domain-containing protein n=1 Tax=uncultured bacterium (gcode 4) TaxID=1234023 RepID=K2FU08_9BACT|nr:MAG: hypothetical protein ACD_4C00300G0004 [uncultured bacterium (gcode 4)]
MHKLKINKLNIVSILIFIAIWQLSIFLFPMWHSFLSSPLDIIEKWYSLVLDNSLFVNVFSSLKLFIISFSLSFIFWFLLALISFYSKFFYETIKPYVFILNSIPIVAFIPIFIIWFGFWDFSKIITIITITFPWIFIATYDWMNNINKDILHFARSFEIKWTGFVYNILFRWSVSHIFSGLKISVWKSIIGLVLSEMFWYWIWLGYLLNIYTMSNDITWIMLVILILLFFNFVIIFLINIIQKIFFKSYKIWK